MSATARTTANRYPERVTYERDAVYAILDEALAVHVGFNTDLGPVVIPTLHMRVGDQLLLHGSAFGRFITTAASGAPLCVTATLIDGVILGRASSHHSAAYRSAMIFGTATAIEDEQERADALADVVESVIPGRLSGPYAARRPNVEEARYTACLTMPITEFSMKVREGFARDEPKDDQVESWAGWIPLTTTPGTPVPDTITGDRFPAPHYDPSIHRFRQN
ncbi:pyridoxamine 5'-phosphate oxidase family protein [Streptomyces sp. NBC_00335]|uniref:pyridoxamine 5'-phosphate oxidase family protein n=1 Tax=unclassified Streptomyces TaxID=2593676 RepID=UPI0022564D0C|nr:MULTISPECIES: pyridoxamine 5'-phosphate oxidase family protein [unclassified Streptomyces]MCX5408951.1 pyridoxamine 5'-phosphate oxidase family protein [Streptomyces sp. NBC_00086]